MTAVRSDTGPIEGPVERIAVFRALVLGDLLCAVPALRALRAACPGASVTLIGLPWVLALAERLSCIDEVIEFPGYPGLPEIAYDVTALPGFLAAVQARRFDLAVQLHGSGPIVNPLVASFGARQTAGFFNDAAWVPPADLGRYTRWPESGHEVHRLLSLTDALGFPRCGTELEFPVLESDRHALEELCPALVGERVVCVHPGSQLPSRRWLPERFAAVADALIEKGYVVVLTGAASEAVIVESVVNAMRHQPISLVGKTTLWTLGALVERAEYVVCNDTGISHIAAALKTPSVVISSGSDVGRWAPLDTERHRVLWADMPCRPCSFAVCPEPHGCAAAVSVRDVLEALERLNAKGLSPAAGVVGVAATA